MYGAILGDIVGSRFEFDRGPWTKDFEFVTDEDKWTDDSVMTIAVAEGLIEAGRDATTTGIEEACTRSMQKWGQRYPYAGYGTRFIGWVLAKDPKPYGSYGNGSAMRVSAVGWVYDSLERTREVARATANVSHNHPEGIKGAECTAAVIYLGRTGVSKEGIKDYVIKEFGYDFSETLEEMRARHKHDETCQDSLPKALRSFIDGESYEDVVRNAISLGGDTDTIAAIAGAMAEGFFDMPIMLRGECLRLVEDDMREILKRFDQVIGRGSSEDNDQYVDNAPLDAAYMIFQDETDENKRTEAFITFLNILAKRISEEAMVPMPFADVNNVMFQGIEEVKVGDTIQLKEEVSLRMDTMKDGEENEWLPLFLSKRELNKGQVANIIMPVAIIDVLKYALEWDSVQGVVINPFGKPLTVRKNMIYKFIRDYEEWIEKNEESKIVE